MKPDQWLEQYYSGEYFTGRFDHLKGFINELDLKKFPRKIITVAGTNGKGETSRCISELLKKNNCNYSLWTSPHLFCVNERFHFNGKDVNDAELLECFSQLKHDSERSNTKLSYFEFLFVAFLKLAKEKQIDYLVLEVGLGGRLDAVNIMDADICVVTSISRDHQNILGHHYRDILIEKLGILRENCQLLSAFEIDYLKDLTHKQALKLRCTWRDLFEDGTLSKGDHFSRRNQVMGQEVVGLLLGPEAKVIQDIDQFAKRFSFTLGGASFSLFPSHNIDGLRKLVQFLKDAKYNNYNHVLISFSDRSLEDLRVMTKIILSYFSNSKVFLYQFNHQKAVRNDLLLKISKEFKLDVTDDKELFKYFKQEASANILVTGSNYFLGEFIKSHHSQSCE